MGLDLLILYIALAAGGVFVVDKGVELVKHSDTTNADVTIECLRSTKEVRACTIYKE